MNFKQARINANLSQPEVIPHLKAIDQRVDIPLPNMKTAYACQHLHANIRTV